MKDWIGNKKSTFVTLGASNHTEKEREKNDFYARTMRYLRLWSLTKQRSDMPKIVLDPEESAIEAFAKLFFSATRNMGFSDKEACEALRNSIEAVENAPAEEKYDWYGSPANIERILQREFKNEMQKNEDRTDRRGWTTRQEEMGSNGIS